MVRPEAHVAAEREAMIFAKRAVLSGERMLTYAVGAWLRATFFVLCIYFTMLCKLVKFRR